MTAVMILGQIIPGADQALEMLDVFPVGEITYPPENEILSLINDIEPCGYYSQAGSVGQYRHYFCEPGDFGASAVVDERTGQVPFLGTVIWAGTGGVMVPVESSHDWAVVGGAPAIGPSSIEVFPSDLIYFMEEATLVANVMAELDQTDVLQSFAACGDYRVAILPYFPAVGLTQPQLAKAVVIVNGTCGAPWNGEPVPVDEKGWGAVKSLYR